MREPGDEREDLDLDPVLDADDRDFDDEIDDDASSVTEPSHRGGFEDFGGASGGLRGSAQPIESSRKEN